MLGTESVHNIAELTSGPPDWSGAVDKFQVPLVSEAYFLDGCRIFLTGFSEPQLEKLHRIINLGGGARYVCTYMYMYMHVLLLSPLYHKNLLVISEQSIQLAI